MNSGKRILERDGFFMNIADAADGKLVQLVMTTGAGIADGFTIGLNPASLGESRAAACSGAFEWAIRDWSLRVDGCETI